MQRFAVLLLSLALLLPFAASAAEINLVVTSGTSRIWDPVDPDEGFPSEDAEKRLSDKVRELSAESGTLVLDLGDFVGYERGTETAYDSRSSAFFSEHGYVAVNATAKDYLLGASHGGGFKVRPAELENFYLSSIDNLDPNHAPLSPRATVSKGGASLRLASISSLDAISAVPGAVVECVAKKPEDVLRLALQDADAPVVVFSDFDRARNERFATEYPGIAAILETAASSKAETTVGSTRIVPRAPGNEIRTVKLEVADDGKAVVAATGAAEWCTPEQYANLVRTGLPIIGMSVPGKGRVAQVLGIDDQSVLVDVHRDQKFADLTPRTNVYAYNLVIDGERYRAYRVHHMVGAFRIPLDALVVLTHDGKVRRIETNLSTWPLRGYNTRLGEAFQSVLNAEPAQWSLPPEAIRGLEDEAERILADFKATIELDRRLYPDEAKE